MPLALTTVRAAHLLIPDVPTNDRDFDAREAVVQWLNVLDGAVLIVSQDRHMLELTADRLVLVDDGTARDFDGSMDDYVAFILGKGAPAKEKASKADRKERSEEHTSELQSLMRISYAVFCLKKKN